MERASRRGFLRASSTAAGWAAVAGAGAWSIGPARADVPSRSRNVIVWSEPGRFGGWPANHGLWAWGDEVVVGFTAAWYRANETAHAYDHDKPLAKWQARSRDGGLTWAVEKPAGLDLPAGSATPPTLAEPIDFSKPDLALMFGFLSTDVGPSFLSLSTDRGHTWRGPFAFKVKGVEGIAARTDLVVLGPRSCLMFASAAKTNGKEGRPFCARTDDGGLSWEFVSWIGPEPLGYCIMPSSRRLHGGEILTTIRNFDRTNGGRIDAYVSRDDGKSWASLGEAAPRIGTGNPPSLVVLPDRRLCLTYGYRARPWGIRARISRDDGRTWGPEIVIRDDGYNGDLGYPRSLARADGSILTVYYFSGPKAENRPIAATIWTP